MRFHGIFTEHRLDECLCNGSERTVFAAGTAHHGPRNVLGHVACPSLGGVESDHPHRADLNPETGGHRGAGPAG